MSQSILGADERKRKQKLFLFGALIGAAVFLAVFGFKELDVTDDSWILGGYIEQDILQHYLGWRSYRAAPLTLPLCITTQFNYPTGISVAYTDSIPLFAVIFRLLAPLLPETFQYFGIFTLLSFMLQGGCAALLLSLFTNGLARPLVGSVLFAASPILLERAFRHTALGAQFLILLALYMYFSARRLNKPLSWKFAALTALAATIHAYFVPLLLAVAFASCLEYAITRKKWLRPAGVLLASIVSALAAAYSVGFFHTGSGISYGYGYFCMNLNSLFNPVSKGIDRWSAVLPVWKQGLGTYEGFNYLGLGALLVCICAAVWGIINFKKQRVWQGVTASLKAHFGLAFVCAYLTVFAISNVVVLNSFVLFEINIPRSLVDLFSTLRASGRMFWLPYYLIMLACCLFVLRRVKAKHALAALAAVCAVQLADMTPALIQKREYLYSETPTYESPFISGFWDIAARNCDEIFTIDTRLIKEPLYMALMAVDNGMTTNLPFAARSDDKALGDEIEAEMARVRAGDIDPAKLYITSDEGAFMRSADYFLSKAVCARVDNDWYVFAPRCEELSGASFPQAEVYVYEKLPFTIADYTDGQWSGGVFNDDSETVCFYDNLTNRALLGSASALALDGERYSILGKSYADKGWIIIKLDRSGEPLRKAELTAE